MEDCNELLRIGSITLKRGVGGDVVIAGRYATFQGIIQVTKMEYIAVNCKYS